MSIVVMTVEGDYILFAKGADSSMLKRMTGVSPQKLQKIQNKINSFAEGRYRTMVMGMRILDDQLIRDFHKFQLD